MNSENGFLNINKPIGITSMDVVRHIRRATKTKKVGHGGTLDPNASGVIPVALGQATRLLEYVLNGPKRYIAELEIGKQTDTFDSEGLLVNEVSYTNITKQKIEEIVSSYKGTTKQIPPMFSALRHNGKRMYDLARMGILIEQNPREVTLTYVEVLAYRAPIIKIELHSSKGFYVRSFANDIGNQLGCGAYLKNLQRIQSSCFKFKNSIDLDSAVKKISDNKIDEIIIEMGSALIDMPEIQLSAIESQDIMHGKKIQKLEQSDAIFHKAYDNNNKFIAIVKYDPKYNICEPEKVFIY